MVTIVSNINMQNSLTHNSSTFINARRKNRRRRYSITSPHQFESRAGTTIQPIDHITNRLTRRNFSQTYSISSNSNLLFPTNTNDLEKYDILTKLNIGAFGASYLIRDSNDGQMYILKRIDCHLPNEFRERLFQERRLLGSLKSSYILSLISSYFDLEHQYFSMKFEYISGITLRHLVRQIRWFEESAVAFYSAQIVLAFEYLHELNIIYGYIKLCDFAYAKLLPSHSSRAYSIVGVPDTIPPEMLLGRPYSFSVDWWQLGIAMFEMLTSRTPFFAQSMLQTHTNVLCHHRYEFPAHVSSSARYTCRLLLHTKVNKRLGCSLIGMDAKEVKENIWFKNQVDWTAIIERSWPTPYKIPDIHMDSKKTVSMLNTIESKWLDEYDQAVRSLMNVSLVHEDD